MSGQFFTTRPSGQEPVTINNWGTYKFISFRDDSNSSEYIPTSQDFVDRSIKLREFNQHIFEELEAELDNFMYHTHDPPNTDGDPIYNGAGPFTPTAASAFHLLMVAPYDHEGNIYDKGYLARVSIQDIIALGLSRYNAWTVVPQMVVKPSESKYIPNPEYNPDLDVSPTNRPYVWTREEGGEGGLWVGTSHVITDIVPEVELLDASEEPYVNAEIDGDYGTTYMTFGIPAGEPGPTGITGPTGWGEKGDAPEILVGTTTTTTPEGRVDITKTEIDPLTYVFDFVLPKGKDGVDGITGATGPQGPTGTPGTSGKDGSVTTFFVSKDGLDGPEGEKGEKGDTGPEGLQGITGEAGFEIEGPPGPPGDTGPTGIQGIQGLKGDKGDQGTKGDTGPKGDTGVTGDRGNDGVSNIPGPTGKTGPKGSNGADSYVPGPTGPTGDTGPRGFQGASIQGPTGPASTITGPIGPTGPRGFKGDDGAPGAPSNVEGPAGSTPEYFYNAGNSTLYILNV